MTDVKIPCEVGSLVVDPENRSKTWVHLELRGWPAGNSPLYPRVALAVPTDEASGLPLAKPHTLRIVTHTPAMKLDPGFGIVVVSGYVTKVVPNHNFVEVEIRSMDPTKPLKPNPPADTNADADEEYDKGYYGNHLDEPKPQSLVAEMTLQASEAKGISYAEKVVIRISPTGDPRSPA